ncbi:hypothetical protein PR048_017422 [Dryococelus australis]|uniref:RNA-directed DNA polymerase n=1 Tax=Dryococelus australis TaxID=614101 RepID=A0ABQ9H9I1_9NEOP|nr:hypothetical protein PR048_017422 [Dryococelus australis]
MPITEKVVRRETKTDPALSKVLARTYYWWPGMDNDIEAVAKTCSNCEMEKPNPTKCELQNWPFITGPWQRIHVDFPGPWQGKLYLIMLEAFSKWLEEAEVPSTAAKHTIKVLQSLFARFGLCTHLVSNGPPFNYVAFQKFLAANGVQSILTPTYHPQSNGHAENSTFTILLSDTRNSVHCTAGETPASLMFGRPLRTIYDLLPPNLSKRVEENQQKQRSHYKGH